MATYYISDIHFGCENKHDGRTLERDQEYIDNHNRIVTNADTVYFLGDIGKFGGNRNIEHICRCISVLKGKNKILIVGNHDEPKDARIKQLFTEICDYKEVSDNSNGIGRNVVLSHYPQLFWNSQHGSEKKLPAIHLYGHLHQSEEEYIYQDALNKVNKYFATRKVLGDPRCEEVHAYNVGAMMPWMNNCPRTLDEIMEWNKNID